jgi:hypothetical protein
MEQITLRILDSEFKPKEGAPYRLVGDYPNDIQGLTLADGMVHIKVPPAATKLTFICGEIEMEINVAAMASADTLTGIKARLNNLGYDAGEPNENVDDCVRQAVAAFRAERGVTAPTDGSLTDQPTKNALVQAYGH